MAKKSKKVNIQQKTVMSRFSGRLSHYLSVERVIVGEERPAAAALRRHP